MDPFVIYGAVVAAVILVIVLVGLLRSDERLSQERARDMAVRARRQGSPTVRHVALVPEQPAPPGGREMKLPSGLVEGAVSYRRQAAWSRRQQRLSRERAGQGAGDVRAALGSSKPPETPRAQPGRSRQRSAEAAGREVARQSDYAEQYARANRALGR